MDMETTLQGPAQAGRKSRRCLRGSKAMPGGKETEARHVPSVPPPPGSHAQPPNSLISSVAAPPRRRFTRSSSGRSATSAPPPPPPLQAVSRR
eukprot:357798-Chlamydomonas_euryale.AAC.2